MRIARFEYGGTVRWGFVETDDVILAPRSGPSLADVLSFEVAEQAAIRDRSSESVALDGVQLLAPVPAPPQFLGVGLNYSDHAAEAGLDPPARPQTFGLLSSAVIGPDSVIELPVCSEQVDWEVELAFVIGKPGKRIPPERALDHLAGYTIVNDLSARDVQFADGQWTRAKSFDTFKPMGPWVTTVDELGFADNLDLQLLVNDVTKQSSNTSNLIFDVPYLVHFLSQEITLETGAVISTGTPGGVGFARQPAEFLRPGDVVRLEINGIGVLTNQVVAAG